MKSHGPTMCGQEEPEIIPCGEDTFLMRFPNCTCSCPSTLYIWGIDNSQPHQKALEINSEDANTLLRRLGLQPLEEVDIPQHNQSFPPLDYGLDQIAGLNLSDMEVDVKEERPTMRNQQEPQAQSSPAPPKAKAPARRNAHEAQIKREKRRKESQHLIKARLIPSPTLKIHIPPR